MELAREELRQFLPGIYLHYKGGLYEADHLTHNASEDGRVEVHYIPLGLDNRHSGPRYATREFREFLFDRVHREGGEICDSSSTPLDHIVLCDEHQLITGMRFRYLGPVFETWMINFDPWKPMSPPK